MSKLKQHDKVERTLRFLVSFSRREVSSKMALRGFSAEDREEGFELVDRAVGRNLALEVDLPEPDKDLITAIDAWENIWFDVADAALRRSFPDVHARVFRNLSKTSGPLVIPNVSVFLERVAKLEKSGDHRDADADALLAKRGLGTMQREYAANLLDQVRTEVDEEDEDDEGVEVEDLDEAIDAMWAWYLDWAKTARTVIKSKRLRIIMGLSSPTSSGARVVGDDAVEEDEEDEEDEDEVEIEDEDEAEVEDEDDELDEAV